MTLRDLILKVLNMPDYISDVDFDPTNASNHIMTTDGKVLTDIWVDDNDNVIIEIKEN